MQFIYPEGATPLNQDEVYNLIPSHITTQKELDEWEQYNILQAEQWAFKIKRSNPEILTIEFINKLHKKMLGQTWKWAGKFRTHQTNIGCASTNIRNELLTLFDDLRYQIAHNVYSLTEIAIRFHHRLVLIHPYPNGNGRLSRLATDIFLYNNQMERFSWGKRDLTKVGEIRTQYLAALRAADKGDYTSLILFID